MVLLSNLCKVVDIGKFEGATDQVLASVPAVWIGWIVGQVFVFETAPRKDAAAVAEDMCEISLLSEMA